MNSFLRFLSLAKKSGNIIEGYNNCYETIKKKKVYLLIFAKELAENSRRKFINSCPAIPYIEEFSKEELGLALGRKEVKLLCVVDENIAKKLISLMEVDNK